MLQKSYGPKDNLTNIHGLLAPDVTHEHHPDMIYVAAPLAIHPLVII